ncbi:MAG: MgtC/SapB family protein [Pseudomonadales bacterium]
MDGYLDPQLVGLGLALGIGLLIGLEREWTANTLIGLRSFALIAVSGGFAALLAQPWDGWIIAVGLAAIAVVIVAHQLRHASAAAGEQHGTTTILAAVATYLIGAACVLGYQTHAVVMAGIITLLLHWKQPLHGLVRRIGNMEFSAIIRFVLISLVVLPVLPNRTFGPYDVVNPAQVWLLVVLIVGLNLIGYVALRMMSARGGAIVGGLVGGLISSTATTVSFSGMTRHNHHLAAPAALIILLASTVVYLRIGVELLAVAPELLPHAAPPLGAFALVMLAAAAAMYPLARNIEVSLPEHQNPARLPVALTFAVLFTVISLAVAASRDHLGSEAIYGVAVVSGLTDVDALTLSVGQLFSRGLVDADVAWRAIFLATLSNLAFKIGVVCVLGSSMLRRYLLGAGAFTLPAGVIVVLFWP